MEANFAAAQHGVLGLPSRFANIHKLLPNKGPNNANRMRYSPQSIKKHRRNLRKSRKNTLRGRRRGA